ncbi:O-antigen ligase family protein [Qipengyuania sp. NPDC077410]|uniref:O-antigen ligase family protein n=1 Tax=Qipengyuania sp. NPDC077410 TaxID=3364496 RepID=UPI0037CB05E1
MSVSFLREALQEYASFVLIFLICLAALIGGGSRADIASLPYLRATAALAIAAACLIITQKQLATIKWPLALLGAIGALCLIQLLPLPPAFFPQNGPRETVREMDQLLGNFFWRPMTLSPSATVNTLGSLLVPAAVLMWLAISQSRTTALLTLVGVGVISASLGLLQLFADPRSGLFFYDITSNGPVGLFANRNHAAVLLACCSVIAIFLYRELHLKIRPALPYLAAFFALCILTNPSRAGLLALGMAAVICTVLQFSTKMRGRTAWMPLFVIGGVGIGVLALFIFANRVPALSRVLENPSLTDLRSELNPISLSMLKEFFPWGSGLGSYEHAYRLFEPTNLLMPSYVNEAHNDWLQFPIEAGLPGIILMTIALGLGACRVFQLRSRKTVRNTSKLPWLGASILLILSVASLVDYPVRVPTIEVLAIVALAFFAGFREDAPALSG